MELLYVGMMTHELGLLWWGGVARLKGKVRGGEGHEVRALDTSEVIPNN